jgi:PTH2 family peptidyl-tRNA hydrolase
MEVKQVIVVRKDLNMRKGKLAAQVAHASMAVVLDALEKETINLPDDRELWGMILNVDDPLAWWIKGAFTKVVVGCNSENELLAIYAKAKDKGLYCSLIKDIGKTEFHGEPTYTSVAIGPAEVSKINEITGSLSLL